LFFISNAKKNNMKKILLLSTLILTAITVNAQDPTIVSNANNCSVFRNFNTYHEDFSSPSIYSDPNDVAFNWDAAAGAEIESSQLTMRTASLISPIYIQSEQGAATIGFKYSVPAGTSYRLRIISVDPNDPREIVATTANGPVYTPFSQTSGNICLLLVDADLVPGKRVRFEFAFRMTQPGNLLFDDLALSVAAGPLPVTFQGFVARKNNDGTIKLLWNVAQEQNVKGYFVETSTNGADFTNGGYVNAAQKMVYSFDYTGKQSELLFFRIKNEDFDGKSTNSSIIKVFAKDQTGSSIQLYPVPANEQVTIQHAKASTNGMITLLSPVGKLLQQVKVAPLTLQTQLNISNLPKGVYIVKYNDGIAREQAVMLIKN